MRVRAPGSSGVAASRADSGSVARPGLFGSMIGDAAQAASAPSGVGAGVALASLEAMLALQAAPAPGERRRRAVRRGHALLDRLEELRLSLLEGELPVTLLRDLRAGLAQRADTCGDLRLAALVEGIELRVAVELAKLEAAAGSGPSGPSGNGPLP